MKMRYSAGAALALLAAPSVFGHPGHSHAEFNASHLLFELSLVAAGVAAAVAICHYFVRRASTVQD